MAASSEREVFLHPLEERQYFERLIRKLHLETESQIFQISDALSHYI